MNRGDLADLNTFLTIADHLSFRAAAAQLGVTSSALSHSVRQLEERLGVRLLHRTTRSVSLTDTGLQLLERLRPGMDQISDALEELKEVRHRPSGRLRIYTQHWAATAVIAPVWQRFLSTYPDVHLELCVESGPMIDIVAGGFDAGLAVRERVPPEMIAVRVTGRMKAAVVASPGYFAKQPVPRTPDDLAAHQCVLYRFGRDGEIFRWRFERNGNKKVVSVRGSVTVNNPETAIRAALDGLGIVYVVDALAEPLLRSGQLVRVLESWSPCVEGVYLYYHSRRQPAAALRAFIEMVRAPKETSNGRSRKNPF
ncbi:LysR family transcriptional regulator [Bradyrhizobium genosp. A]|uniref:LysR family transcriptional regulator n=1 Tax=Bradyrhizobium genosp. A TaxID=83626 RepID=UPI003CEF9CC4